MTGDKNRTISEKDVKHLAELSRLELTDEEISKYTNDIGEILNFVGKITEVAGEDDAGRIENTISRNVFRKDDSPVETGTLTEDILNQAPETKDDFMKVKKILNNNSDE